MVKEEKEGRKRRAVGDREMEIRQEGSRKEEEMKERRGREERKG